MNRIEVYCFGSGVDVLDKLACLEGVALVLTRPERHPQRGHHQIDVLGRRRVPSDDPLGEDIENERDVDEPGRCASR
ncbi:hypothetical protein [Georgenia daeguensis]|uniref:Uncharacterized protein n=1 Tax=Georgenia daeguensis TaxID=908355 RepID=A0ABP8EYF9_9MICO